MALARRTESSNDGGGSGIDYENLATGEHEGRLVYVADLGIHNVVIKGKDKGMIQSIALGIEIIGQTITAEDKELPRFMWTKPFNIYDSLTEKGFEIQMYSVFDNTANVGEVPDWEAQLGKPCTVVVEHVHKDDKTYDNVKSLLSIPEKYQDGVGAAVLETGIGDSEDKDNDVNGKLFGLAKWVFDRRTVATDPALADDDNGDGPY